MAFPADHISWKIMVKFLWETIFFDFELEAQWKLLLVIIHIKNIIISSVGNTSYYTKSQRNSLLADGYYKL